jgi:hypothetical protein
MQEAFVDHGSRGVDANFLGRVEIMDGQTFVDQRADSDHFGHHPRHPNLWLDKSQLHERRAPNHATSEVVAVQFEVICRTVWNLSCESEETSFSGAGIGLGSASV